MPITTRVRLDRISSATRNLHLPWEVILGDEIISAEGYALAIRILTDKSSYNTIEDVTGRMVSLRSGDILAGVLGSRRALRGYAGEVPAKLAVGDNIEVLNLGGVLGKCTSMNPEIGPPFQAEVLGSILSFPELGDRVGKPATIRDNAVPMATTLECKLPIVFVVGTCMNAGKTIAATEIVRGLARSGFRVGAVKLTGVSLLRDALSMQDAGAVAFLTFNDAGLASTHPGTTVAAAKGLLNQIAKNRAARPDVIVAELGDGILGEYGVQDILGAQDITNLAAAWVMAAPDPVACWGAAKLFEDRFKLPITAITGPATDNGVGRDYIRDQLHLPAHNAIRDAAGLVGIVREALQSSALVRETVGA